MSGHASSSPASASSRRSASAASASGITSAAAAAARARSPSSTPRRSPAASRRRSPASRSTMCRRSTGDDIWDAGYRADPKRYSRAALIGVIAAREAWADAGLRIGEPSAGVVIGSGGGGIDVGERQYHDFFVERGKQGHAVRDSGVDRRHGVERDLDLAAAARHQPRAVVRLHELDRRDRLRRGADPRRARPTCCCRAAPTRASRRA